MNALMGLKPSGFCGQIREHGLQMADRGIAFFTKEVSTGQGPLVAESPWDYDRGGRILLFNLNALHPRIAVGHEPIHDIIKPGGLMEPYGEKGTPFGTADQASKACGMKGFDAFPTNEPKLAGEGAAPRRRPDSVRRHQRSAALGCIPLLQARMADDHAFVRRYIR